MFTGSPAAATGTDTVRELGNMPRYGLHVYDSSLLKVKADGNMYTNGNAAGPGSFETNVKESAAAAPVLIVDTNNQVRLQWSAPNAKGQFVTTELLGKAKIPQQRFENPDGGALAVSHDYFGHPRSRVSPNIGPFENTKWTTIAVWPKK